MTAETPKENSSGGGSRKITPSARVFNFNQYLINMELDKQYWTSQWRMDKETRQARNGLIALMVFIALGLTFYQVIQLKYLKPKPVSLCDNGSFVLQDGNRIECLTK